MTMIPFVTGQGHDDPLAPTHHLAHRRAPAVPRELLRRTAVQQERVEDLDPPQLRPTSAGRRPRTIVSTSGNSGIA